MSPAELRTASRRSQIPGGGALRRDGTRRQAAGRPSLFIGDKVIITGVKIASQAFEIESAKKKVPHQTNTSPK